MTGNKINQSEDSWKLNFPYKTKTYVAVVVAALVRGSLNCVRVCKVIVRVWECAKMKIRVRIFEFI